MSIVEKVQETTRFIREQISFQPKVGVVLGSGLGAFADKVEDPIVIPYAEIPHFPEGNVVGHAGQLVLGSVKGVPVAVMSGRVHYYEGHSMEAVTFPTRVLTGLGVETLLITNAAGTINKDYKPGDLMVITDHINLTGDNPLRGTNDERLGPRFPDMSNAYTTEIQGAWQRSAESLGVELRQGVYVGLAGPSYETPAEIRMLRVVGADAVGMSTVAEVIVASHAGVRVGGLSVVTNYAAGIMDEPLSHEEVTETGKQVRPTLCALLEKTIGEIG